MCQANSNDFLSDKIVAVKAKCIRKTTSKRLHFPSSKCFVLRIYKQPQENRIEIRCTKNLQHNNSVSVYIT